MGFWADLRRADDFAGDPYGWVTCQAGHILIGEVALAAVLVATPLQPLMAVAVVATIYFVGWERLFQRGPDLWDSVVDAAFVTLGALLPAAWLLLGAEGAAAVIVVGALAMLRGVIVRDG